MHGDMEDGASTAGEAITEVAGTLDEGTAGMATDLMADMATEDIDLSAMVGMEGGDSDFGKGFQC